MKNMIKNLLALFAVAALLSGAGYGQMTSYAYKRTIDSVTQKGWHAIPLDARILAKTQMDLRDIRIFELSNSDTFETPYIIESLSSRSDIVEIPFTAVNKSYDANAFYLTLMQSERKTINQIHLDFAERNFDWKVTVEGSFDQKQWQTVTESQRITRINNDYVNYSFTDLHFEPSNYDVFRITVKAGAQSKRIRFLSAVMYDVKKESGHYAGLEVSGQTTAEKKKEKQTEILIPLKGKQRVSRVVFDASHDRDYYRSFRLYYLRGMIGSPKGEHENWGLLTSGVISSLEKPDFSFEPVITERLKLEVMNQSDRPLQYGTTAVFAAISQLVAELNPEKDYILAYGKMSDAAPQYDIVHFTGKIPEKRMTAKLSHEMSVFQSTERKTEPWFLNTWWIWGTMILVILLLGYFSWKMIKGAGERSA